VSTVLLTDLTPKLWSTPMIAITPMIRARGDGIPSMKEKGRSEQQSMMGDQSLQVRRHSIDRSSTAARSVSISNPSIDIPEAGGIGRSPLTQAEPVPQAFSFGPFRIVPRARLLERDGSRTPVGSRAFDLLCVLVSRPGEVVSKGELMARVWPDITVEESNLRVHIAHLRRTLGDGQEGKRYVTNVPGRGYCFVARVDRTASAYI
jgi:DNA-binding winged helix-turn-helix (wHTH) protein